MYERKIPVDLDCPLRLTMSLLGSKWKSCILDELRHRSLRPSELHKLLPEATPRVLDLQLRNWWKTDWCRKPSSRNCHHDRNTASPNSAKRSSPSLTP